MTVEKFLELVKESGACLYKKETSKKSRRYDSNDYFTHVGSKEPIDMKCGLYCKWSTGGVTGGSCWGGENYAYTSNDNESEELEESLEKILTAIKPNLKFTEYRKLIKGERSQGLIEYLEETECEYYGNSTNYSIKWLPLQKLYDMLEEMKLLGE